MRATPGLIGAGDADIMVSLKEKHHSTANYVALRKTLPRDFPGVTFYFLPADILTQVLNFGLPERWASIFETPASGLCRIGQCI